MKNELEMIMLKKAYDEATELICLMENERIALKKANQHLRDIVKEKQEQIDCLVECLNCVLSDFKE